ncbi:MAG TPA: hypothetical protein VNB54_13555, partial [Alphaproteobacteria bacterium]|nr:hypothetical protein [Alphaproteobacteria bacterium]
PFNIETTAGTSLGNVVPTSIQTTIYPSGKVSLVAKTYAPPAFTGGPISGDVATEKVYDWAYRGKTNLARCSGKPTRSINGRRTAPISPRDCSICRPQWL